MTRLKAISPEEATGKTKELFNTIQTKLGVIPNMMRTMGNSPAVLESYLNFSATLGHGLLGAKTGELLALAISENNSCEYCVAAHSYIGEKLVHIDDQKLTDARSAKSADPKTEAALNFALVLTAKKGLVNDNDVAAVKTVGFTDGEIGEIVAHVALNILTNYFNNTANTAVDFPVVQSLQTV